MSGWLPPRLRPLLGADCDVVTADGLQRLIGLPEETDLEFKAELHGTTEGEQKEAAYDIAQFANAGGGLLLFGIEEDGEGRATEIVGVRPIERDYGLWIHQVIASRIVPTPLVVHRVLPLTDRSVHLISVSPSILQPHLVSVGGDAYRIPMRSGNTRRWLREPELAAGYRRRLSDITARDLVTDELQDTGAQFAPFVADNEERAQKYWSWLVVSLVADVPGSLTLRRGIQEEWSAWLRPALTDFPNQLDRQPHVVRLAFRSLTFSDSIDPTEPVFSVAGVLRLDGSGVVVFGHPGGQGAVGIRAGTSAVYDENLIADLINGVSALAGHAIRSGAVGDATVAARLLCRRLPMVVAQSRARMSVGPLYGSHEAGRDTGVSRHTLPIDLLSGRGSDTLLGPRLLSSDLLSAFGLPEAAQINEDLELVANRFNASTLQGVRLWAEQRGVRLVES